jgi:hypothetical protein
MTTLLIVLIPMVICGVLAPNTLFVMVPIFLFVLYFFISPFFGYVEFRDHSLLIRYGFFLRREIPYHKIRSVQKERKWYCESMLSLKNALEHINIKYNTFDVTTISVTDNDEWICELKKRCSAL